MTFDYEINTKTLLTRTLKELQIEIFGSVKSNQSFGVN
jgi:hypothetical protein